MHSMSNISTSIYLFLYTCTNLQPIIQNARPMQTIFGELAKGHTLSKESEFLA